MPKSDLPFGSEFSPSQIDLRRVLELAHERGGDWRAFEGAVRLASFDKNQTTDVNRRKLANNTKLGMIAYGLKFSIDNGAAIPPNLIALAHTESNSYYLRYCKEHGLEHYLQLNVWGHLSREE